ncbi:MAG: alpha/beta fold hydrolase [Alphaproteobacteria bacterium]|nr:alpha/beta fold hydrolase [Alphaproteobacteria bacterium]
MVYRFGGFTLDPLTYDLQCDGEPISVEPQVFSVINLLIENRDHVVSKDELIEAVWDGRIVSDATLSSRISAARSARGDTGQDQNIIRTIPRRGFRFVAEVSADGATENPPPGSPDTRPTIRYCTTADDVQLAYAFAGEGPPLLKVANWLNHLEFDWASPMWAPLFHEFTRHRQLLRYDSRGVGLSDWDVGDFAFDLLVEDMEAVIDASGVEKFALLGISQGAAIAIDYAARNPDRVSHLILWGGFARGRRKRGNQDDYAESEAFITLMRQGWGKETSPFRQMFASLYLPDANDEQIKWWTDMQRTATSPENAVHLRETIDDLDVTEQLSKVQTPTLIVHSEREAVAPLSEARFMAARIPNAKFVALDSANHLVLHQEPSWQRAVSEIEAFLSSAP